MHLLWTYQNLGGPLSKRICIWCGRQPISLFNRLWELQHIVVRIFGLVWTTAISRGTSLASQGHTPMASCMGREEYASSNLVADRLQSLTTLHFKISDRLREHYLASNVECSRKVATIPSGLRINHTNDNLVWNIHLSAYPTNHQEKGLFFSWESQAKELRPHVYGFLVVVVVIQISVIRNSCLKIEGRNRGLRSFFAFESE